MVSIVGKDGAFPGFGKNISCVGIIIDEFKIVLPAHCVYDYKKIIAFFGTLVHEKSKTVMHFTRKNVVIHPDYVDSNAGDDIAIIISKTPLEFGKYKIPLIEKNSPICAGENVKFIGYGVDASEERLKWTQTTIMDFEKCKNIYYEKYDMHELYFTYFCLEYQVHTKLSNGNKGDAGGKDFFFVDIYNNLNK